jgi:hypothetical protein
MIPDNAGAGTNAYVGQGSEFLKAQRERFGKEFTEHPELKKRIAALVDLENPKAGIAVAESLMNRMAYSHGTMASGSAGGPRSFYGPGRHTGMVEARIRELERNPKRMADRMAQISAALGGSNITTGFTDQGSRGDPNYIAGGTGVNINRERFNLWGGGPGGHEGARRFREEQQRRVAGEQSQPLTGSRHGDSGAHLRDHIRHQHSVKGDASLRIDLHGFPKGTRTSSTHDGLFTSLKLNRGSGMRVDE